ncbi:hypothetical protein FRC14_000185 [Serendipita sp. 396]|nr:hypothetical protein FRC14_000185 [Serendipita sp. 396]KAG8776001.1 hypothetical protein FRC15_000198 [Serendipita sp. 397]KAG8792184.1 hypothetical protein FRC16_011511 [Serendipita sp. 398]KAG8852994.1 hypothetical protein FRC20_001345 [Serendipita sp. 405]
MQSRIDSMSISEAPTAVHTPTLLPLSLQPSKEDLKPKGVVLTATNTIDTIAVEDAAQSTKVESESEPSSETALANASTLRKLALLAMFTLAEFLDAFNNSALFPAIPNIASQLRFEVSETTWIIAGYQLTFAAFLLVSGRISDIYTPKPAFIAGSFILGLTHLIGGFTHQKIALLVLRALGGIGGALTIPSALSLIIQLFPDPSHQARAIALFGSAGAIGNVLGILIGAVLVQYAGWAWIFWFVAIVGMGVALICLILIPNAKRDKSQTVKFDVPGVSMLTIAVILFIFAVTSGSTQGWATAYVLAPLIISLVLAALFFVWEARIPFEDAVLPPRMWQYRNFGILVSLALIPYFWWVTSFLGLTAWWESVYGWSAINTAVHFLPMGIGAWLISNFTGRLPSYFSHRVILISGLLLSIVATILLPFADSPDMYWPIVFPAFTLGTVGMMVIFANSSIAIFAYTPPSVAGTVGAVFNCALQLGSAVGLAAVSSITTSIDERNAGRLEIPVTEWSRHLDEITKPMWRLAFKGRAASYWFLLAILVLLLVAVFAFFKADVPVHHEDQGQATKAKQDVESGSTVVEEKH